MTWIVICIGALVILATHLRNSGCSLGLPFAYLSLLQLNHVPGAVVLGLRSAVLRSQFTQILGWVGALFAYPIWSLIVGGFLSYGSTAVFIALSPLVVSARSGVKVIASSILLVFLGLTIFVNWFA